MSKLSRAIFSLAILLSICADRGAVGQAPTDLRVLTYNIRHGEGADGNIDLERIAQRIKAAEPDLVALQEVDQKTARGGGVDQPAELARLTGMQVAFGRNIDFDGGGYGTAVLSRRPIVRRASRQLPSFYQGEQRGVQIVEVEPAGTSDDAGILFFCTHLDYRPVDAERMASAKLINELAAKSGDRLMILAGDLNATPPSRVIGEFEKQWRQARAPEPGAPPLFTFPAEQPAKQIDFILFRPAGRWRVVEVRVIDEPLASDHRPLLAVLRRVDVATAPGQR